jgi:hypothetical protein
MKQFSLTSEANTAEFLHRSEVLIRASRISIARNEKISEELDNYLKANNIILNK